MVKRMVEYLFRHTASRSHLKRVLDAIRERWRTDIVTAPGIFCSIQTQPVATSPTLTPLKVTLTSRINLDPGETFKINDVPNHSGANPPVTIKKEDVGLNDPECSQEYMFAVMGARSGLRDIVKSVGDVEFERADKEEEQRSVYCNCKPLRCSMIVVSNPLPSPKIKNRVSHCYSSHSVGQASPGCRPHHKNQAG